MTVSYSEHVFTSTGHGIFLRLLCRWTGSIYKLVWRDLVFYVILYSFLSFLYRFVLPDQGKVVFEKISLFCGHYAELIPVTFVLGFYVSLLVTRWWKQFETMPWPDSAAVWISTCIKGHDVRGRLMRRTIIRYINLCLILTFRLISLPVKKRFPTLQHLEEAGILEGRERQIFEKMDAQVNHPKYWMPLVWAGSIVQRARKENRIANDYMMLALIEQIDKFRGMAGGLLNHDWVNIPLVYTQVVTLAVYTFLLSTLMGRQFLNPKDPSILEKYPGHEIDLVVPWFTFLQFFFYMGWLKVAEALINPFGEDDDDFETNWIIDRNLQVSYLIVDEMHSEHPDMVRDQFWDDLFPELPYTAAAEETRTEPTIGGTCNYEVPENAAEFLPLISEDEDEENINAENKNLVKSRTNEKSFTDLNGKVVNKDKDVESGLNIQTSTSGVGEKLVKSSKNVNSNVKKSKNNIRRSEFGSVISVDKPRSLKRSNANSASGISLVSRLHTALRGRGPGSVIGNSHISLLSNLTNRKRPSRKPSGPNLGRSVSRVSNVSPPASRRGQSPEDSPSDEDSTMFKFSSASSLDQQIEDTTVNEWVKKNAHRRKKYSNASSAQSPKPHGKMSNSIGHHGGHGGGSGIKSPSRVSRISSKDRMRHISDSDKALAQIGNGSSSDKALVRHLELMHNFTSEAVKLLKKEDQTEDRITDDDIEKLDQDSSKIFRALEENHEELRLLLLRKLKPRYLNSRQQSITTNNPTDDNAGDTDNNTDHELAILKVGSQFHENFRENSNNLEQQQQQNLEDHPENLIKSKNEKSFTDLTNHPGSCWKKTIEDPENPGLTLENPVGLLIQDRDIDGEMADNEEEEDIDKSNEENTILFKDNASILEDSVPLIEEDPKLLEISIDTNQSKLETILDNNTADSEFLDSTGNAVINLATIEEQPELGYQSDSEGISAMSSTLKNSSNRKCKDSNSSIGSSGNHLALGTLTEDSKEIEENEEKVTKIVEIENLTLQK